MKTAKGNRERLILLVLLPLIVLLCISIWVLQRATPKVEIYSESGVYDLRTFDFSQATAVPYRVVEYIPWELVSPEEFAARDDIQVGKIPDDLRVVTMRQRILVPEGRLYGVCGYAANFANRIYINGKWLYDEGMPSLTADAEKPKETYHFFTVEPEDGVIEILIQTSSFSHKDVSAGIKVIVGTYEICRTHYLRSMTATIIVMGWYILMALVFLTLFLVLPSYKGNGWLALMCVVWAVRTGVMGNKPLLTLFPPLDWATGYHIEKASASIVLLFLTLALHAMFPGALPRWLRRVVVCVSCAMAAAAFLVPTRLYSNYSSEIMQGIYLMALLIVACILLSLRKRRPTPPQVIILVGLGLLLFAYVWDMIYYYAGFSWPVITLLQPVVLAVSLLLLEAAMLHTMTETAKAHERERRAEAENEMLSEMNRLKSAFYTDMSHEMKTPLTVIAVNAQFAAQNIGAGAVDEETVTDLNAISTEARRLAQMVTSLVGIGRMQDKADNKLSLDSLLQETARIYQSLFARKHNTLTVETAPDLPQVEGSADQLVQVLINLLSNANRHTNGGAVSIGAEAQGDWVRVCVTDTGEGVAPALLPHVFERFRHGEQGGSGLGLAICKTIIEEHGGEIGIESVQGQGTTVWFTLPAKEVTAHEADGDDPAGGGR